MKSQWLRAVVLGFGLTYAVLGAAQEKGSWRAASTPARSITGDVGLSNFKLWISFSSFPLAQIRTLKPAELAAAFDADDSAAGSGNLYRISIPGTTRFVHKNTLCGDEETQWVATYVVGHSLQLLFFSGATMPVLTPEALTDAPNRCGAFAYVK